MIALVLNMPRKPEKRLITNSATTFFSSLLCISITSTLKITTVIPAKAGIHQKKNWVPIFKGMTKKEEKHNEHYENI